MRIDERGVALRCVCEGARSYSDSHPDASRTGNDRRRAWPRRRNGTASFRYGRAACVCDTGGNRERVENLNIARRQGAEHYMRNPRLTGNEFTADLGLDPFDLWYT